MPEKEIGLGRLFVHEFIFAIDPHLIGDTKQVFAEGIEYAITGTSIELRGIVLEPVTPLETPKGPGDQPDEPQPGVS
jgi:hypothetical protein